MRRRDFKPDGASRKALRREKKEQRMVKMNRERRAAEEKAKRKYRAWDYTWLSLNIKAPCPKGFLNQILIRFDMCIKTEEVNRRLEKAFGDL